MAENDDIENREISPGLRELAGQMDSGAFACFLSIMNWAKCWQAMSDAGILDADNARAMMLWLTGVGADPFSWSKHAGPVGGVLQNEITKWTSDAVYRDANTMPWCVLSVAGPAFAGSSKGMNYQVEAHRAIYAHFTPGETPKDVPKLTDVIAAVERRREIGESADALADTAAPGTAAPNANGGGLPQQPQQPNRQPPGKRADPFAGLGAAVRRPV